MSLLLVLACFDKTKPKKKNSIILCRKKKKRGPREPKGLVVVVVLSHSNLLGKQFLIASLANSIFP